VRRFTDALPVGVLLSAFAATDAASYEDGAPPGHTGGFGEPDCSECHSDNDRNAAGGSLTLQDHPPKKPGGPRLLVVVLEHPELRSGGFQLAIRTRRGKPAGRPVPISERTRVVADGEQPYLQHSLEGREPEGGGRISWRFEWSPPGAGDAVIHVAANAANDDISALGDFIYTLEKTVVIDARAAGTGRTRASSAR
jgi:hypothetical protein